MDSHVTTEQALVDLSSGHYDHILLDFDHTLLLDNSTERFLDTLRPRLLAFLLVAASDWLVRALAWFGLCSYNAQRDFMRVLICTALMPWSALFWTRAARRLAQSAMNQPLINALPPNQPIVVLSFGFRHVIKPILNAAGLSQATLVCSDVARWENLRASGKPQALAKYAPDFPLNRAVFVTDSHDDDAVVSQVARAHLVQWGPYTAPAFQNYYVPMRYAVQGKYANSRYFTYQILLEDFALLLLAYAFSPWYAVGLWCLFLSLYAIYEIGYFENDHLAASREAMPAVSEEARGFKAHPRYKPWAWAVIFGVSGILATGPAGWRYVEPSGLWLLRAGTFWVLTLVCVRGVFFLFNRLAPAHRIPVFPLLHVMKTFAFALFVPLTLIGALLLAAQAASLSLNYTIYRLGGNPDRFNRQAWRLLLFLALVCGAFVLAPADIIQTSPTRFILILVWCATRSIERGRRKNILRIIGEFVRSKGDG